MKLIKTIKNIILVFVIVGQSIFGLSYNRTGDYEDNWSINDWWVENNGIDYLSQIRDPVRFVRQGSLDNLTYEGELLNHEFGEVLTSEESEVRPVRRTTKPKTTRQDLLNIYAEFFTNVRSNRGNNKLYHQVRNDLKKRLLDYGLETASQSFWPPEIGQYYYGERAYNIIGVLPGPKRGIINQDQIIIIGAHYDTVPLSPGVNDNGSGATAVMEIARLLTANKCKLNKTVMFVLFDMEEDGLKGSKHFVKDYLLPNEVKRNGAKIVGAIIMDMILEHDQTPNSQALGSFGISLPEWARFVKQNQYRGDFAAVWARKGIDTELFRVLKQSWLNQDKFKISLMAPPLPKYGWEINSNIDVLRRYNTFFRSDHASFWYPTKKDISFNAVLITDLGPWRKNVAKHYHKRGDDRRMLTEANLQFLKNTVDSLTATILNMSDGKCFK